jgi:hypothetical protein
MSQKAIAGAAMHARVVMEGYIHSAVEDGTEHRDVINTLFLPKSYQHPSPSSQCQAFKLLGPLLSAF